MKTKSRQEKQKYAENANQQCAHHWIIEPPNGPVSKGVCKKCGATKEFENWGQIEK